MKKINQQGLAHLGLVLVVVLVGIIGFAGWKVYQASQDTKQNLDNASKSDPAIVKKETKTETKKTTVETPDPTADWTSYSNKEGKFSLKYPKSWVTAKNPDLCSPGVLLLGQTESSVGKCATDSGGEILISSTEGNKAADYLFITNTTYYSDISKQDVTVNRVTGTKHTATAKEINEDTVGPAAGTKVTQYVFVANNRTYVATYNQAPGAKSIMDDFNLIVTKTLKFE